MVRDGNIPARGRRPVSREPGAAAPDVSPVEFDLGRWFDGWLQERHTWLAARSAA